MPGRTETSSSFWLAKAAIAKTFASRKPPVNTGTRDSLCKITRGLYLSSCHLEAQRAVLQDHGVTHILQVGQELSPTHPGIFKYKHVPVYDLEGEDLVSNFEDCFAFINAGREAGAVLVHCAAGISRSASVVIAYLMAHGGLSLEDARSAVKAARPAINPNQGFTLQLQLFQDAGCTTEGWEPWDLERFLQVRAETYSRRPSGSNNFSGTGRSVDGLDESSPDAGGTLRGACEVAPPTLTREESDSPVGSPSHSQAARQRMLDRAVGVDSDFNQGSGRAVGGNTNRSSLVGIGIGNVDKAAEMGTGNDVSSGESAGHTSPMGTAIGATGVTWREPSVAAHLALPPPEGMSQAGGHLSPAPYPHSYPYPNVQPFINQEPSASSLVRVYHRQRSADAAAAPYVGHVVPVAGSGFIPRLSTPAAAAAAVATMAGVVPDASCMAAPPPQSPNTTNGVTRASVTSVPDFPTRPHTISGATTEVGAAALWAQSQALMQTQPMGGVLGQFLAPTRGLMTAASEQGEQLHGPDAGGRLAAHASAYQLHGIVHSGGSAEGLRACDVCTGAAGGGGSGSVPAAAASSSVTEAWGFKGITSELYRLWASAVTSAPEGGAAAYDSSSGITRNGAGRDSGGSSLGSTETASAAAATSDAAFVKQPGEGLLAVRAHPHQPILSPAGLDRTPSKRPAEEADTGSSEMGAVAATAETAADPAPYCIFMNGLPLNLDCGGAGGDGDDGLEPPLLLPASPQGNGADGNFAAAALLGHIRADAEITSSRTGSLGGASIQVASCDEEAQPLSLPLPQHDHPMGHMLLNATTASASDSVNATLATAAPSRSVANNLRSSRLATATFAHRPSLDGADPNAATPSYRALPHASGDSLDGAVPLPHQPTPRPQLLPPATTTSRATTDNGSTRSHHLPPQPSGVYGYNREEEAKEVLAHMPHSAARTLRSMSFSLPSHRPSMSAGGPTVPVLTGAAATASGVEGRQPQVQRQIQAQAQPHSDVQVAVAATDGFTPNCAPERPTGPPTTQNGMRLRLSLRSRQGSSEHGACSSSSSWGGGEGGSGAPLAQRVLRSITSLLTRVPESPTAPVAAPDANYNTFAAAAKQAVAAMTEGSAESVILPATAVYRAATVPGNFGANTGAEFAGAKLGGDTAMAATRQDLWSVDVDSNLAAGSTVWSVAGSSGLQPSAGSDSSSSSGGGGSRGGCSGSGEVSVRAAVVLPPAPSAFARGGPAAPMTPPDAIPSIPLE